MITFSNTAFQTDSQTTHDAIGHPTQIHVWVDTNFAYAGSLSDTLNVFVAPALFVDNPAVVLSENATNPGNVFVGSFASGAVLPQSLELDWTGTAAQKYGRCFVDLVDNAGTVQIKIKFKFVAQSDKLTYTSINTHTNLAKLLKNEIKNAADLDNSTTCVYNKNKNARLALWVQESATGNFSFTKLNTGNTINARFYNSESLAAPTFARLDALPTILLVRNSANVTSLSLTEDSFLYFTVPITAGFLATKAYVLAIRTDQQNNSIDYLANYQAQWAEIPLNNTSPYTLTIPPTNFADWNLDNTGFWVGGVGSGSEALHVTSGTNYRFLAKIDKDALTDGGKYRFIVVLQTDTDPAASSFEYYSFITDEFSASPCLELTIANTPIASGLLADYFNEFGNAVIMTAKERFRSVVGFDGTPYNAAFTLPLEQAFNRIRLRVYSLEDPNLTHVYIDESYTKNAFGVWTSPLTPYFAVGNNLTTVFIIFDYRLRYEDNLPCLYTLVGNVSQPPLASMNWSGRRIYIEYTLGLTQPEGNQSLIYTQFIDVKPPVSDFTVEFTKDGAPVYVLCEGDLGLDACATWIDQANNAMISTIESTPLNFANIKEWDDGLGILPQLQQLPLLSTDTFLDGDGKGCAQIYVQELELGTEYVWCVIAKGTPIFGCGQATPASGDAAGYPAPYDAPYDAPTASQNVGNDLGYVVMTYQTYGFLGDRKGTPASSPAGSGADATYLNWNAGTPQISNNNSTAVGAPTQLPFVPTDDPWHQNDGVLIVNKTAATPTSVDIAVRAFNPASKTQWWFKVFCPNGYNDCGRSYQANVALLRKQVGANVLLHEEAYLFEWDGTNDFFLDYSIPVQSVTFGTDTLRIYYQISVYYNGTLEDRTTTGAPDFFVFLDGSGTLTIPAGTHVGGIDAVAVIFTMMPVNFDTNPVTLPVTGFQLWSFTPRCRDTSGDTPKPCSSVWDYGIPTSLDDNNSVTQCFTLPPVVDCPDPFARSCGELWNANLCGNDSRYWQPVCVKHVSGYDDCDNEIIVGKCQETDLLDFQFHFPDTLNDWADPATDYGWKETAETENWLISMEVLDDCCQPTGIAFTTFATDWFVGADVPNFYQQVRVDPSKINRNCFILAITVNNPDPCKVKTYYLEPYKKVACENTTKLRGVNSVYDCEDNLYIAPPNVYAGSSAYFGFVNEYRVYGVLELDSYTINKEELNNRAVSTESFKNYKLKPRQMPPYAAYRLAAILKSQFILSEYGELNFMGDVAKNNAVSKMWMPDITLKQIDCQLNSRCV